MHSLEEERIEKINKWLETVESISSKSESLYNEDDPLTYLDSVSINTVKYMDGTCKFDKGTPTLHSTFLREIDTILQKYGFVMGTFTPPQRSDLYTNYYYNGHSKGITITPNCFHDTYVDINIGRNSYRLQKLENGYGVHTSDPKVNDKLYDLESIILNILKSNIENKSLLRTLKILSIE